MLETDRMDVESRDVDVIAWLAAVGDGELQVIVEKVLVLLQLGVLGAGLETNGVSAHGVVHLLASHENGQAVQRHVNAVLSVDEPVHPLEFISVDLDLAQRLAPVAGHDLQLVRSWLDFESLQAGSQVPAVSIAFVRRDHRAFAAWELVEIVRHLRLLAGDEIGEHPHRLPAFVELRGHAREQDGGEAGLLLAQQTLALLLAEVEVTHAVGILRVANLILTFLLELLVRGLVLLDQLLALLAVQLLLGGGDSAGCIGCGGSSQVKGRDEKEQDL
mmetsp:Transcript_9161/g.26172  ORF Transcript_9161/g.26172 Transcript_9161/m.26172 type:complete len:274 (-) Transcript_9161:94-915(-)